VVHLEYSEVAVNAIQESLEWRFVEPQFQESQA